MADDWRRVASAADFPTNDMRRVVVNGQPITLYNLDGEFFATHDICTHELASLADGYLDGDVIECPLHQGCFNIKTGKALSAPVTEDIATYAVKVEGGDVLVSGTVNS